MDIELASTFQIADDVVLRHLEESDADEVYAAVIRNRERLKPYMHWMTDEYSLDDAREFIQQSHTERLKLENAGYGIFRGETFVGAIGYVYFDWKVCKTEIGYWIDRAEEGKGLVSAASKLLIEYAFGELSMNRIEIRCAVGNRRSAAIPERFGFTREAVLRESEIRDGKRQDFAVYAMLAREWAQ